MLSRFRFWPTHFSATSKHIGNTDHSCLLALCAKLPNLYPAPTNACMLKKIKRLFSADPVSAVTLERIPASEHGIRTREISGNALKVIDELQREGFEAYLVGGGVRDLLLGGHPKDFDIATDATPEEVTRVFRRARIIGRRFKIVHVRMGREVLEVTTFRGTHEGGAGKRHAVQSDKGILLRDNVYGDLQSDALRRDFSVNALYYDPSSEEILDYTGGMRDLKARRLSIIGDPEARYKEDPVRMLRAIRFRHKLNFELAEETEAPIRNHANYLLEIPPARLFEEVLKLFLSGQAESTLRGLHEYHLLPHLFPGAAEILDTGSEQHQRLLYCAAANTDERIASNKRVTPAFIYAAFLWPTLQEQMEAHRADFRGGDQELLMNVSNGVLLAQQQKTAIPKRFQIPMREIWNLQLRFDRRDGKRAFAMLEHPRFRAAYDFILLREQSGEDLKGLGAWWTEFQHADRDRQIAMVNDTKSAAPKRRRRRRRPARKPQPE